MSEEAPGSAGGGGGGVGIAAGGAVGALVIFAIAYKLYVRKPPQLAKAKPCPKSQASMPGHAKQELPVQADVVRC